MPIPIPPSFGRSEQGGVDFHPETLRYLREKKPRVYPLRLWRRRDVFAYLSQRQIPIPPSFGRSEQGGVDFHPETLRYLREKKPRDYRRFLEVFPYAEAHENERLRTHAGGEVHLPGLRAGI